jgi:YD repeat-containing protein
MGRLIGRTMTLRLRSVQGYSFLASRNFTNAYTYDAASNRTGFTDLESGSTAYSYDTLNRLTSLAPPSAFGSGSFGFSGVYPESLARERAVAPHADDAAEQCHDQLHLRQSVAAALGAAPTVREYH